MKRELWTYAFDEKSAPAWPCPIYAKGIYVLVPKSIVFKETVTSKRSRGQPDSDPELLEYAFIGWLKCSHCDQEAIVACVGGVEPGFNEEKGEMEWGSYYLPRICWPMPDIFDNPRRCPEEVKKELRAGFALFWVDEGAAANRLRIALELLIHWLLIVQRVERRDFLHTERITPYFSTQVMKISHSFHSARNREYS